MTLPITQPTLLELVAALIADLNAEMSPARDHCCRATTELQLPDPLDRIPLATGQQLVDRRDLHHRSTYLQRSEPQGIDLRIADLQDMRRGSADLQMIRP